MSFSPFQRETASRTTSAGRLVSRYGLVLVLVWFGAGKYVKMDSRVLIEHSPLMAWIYDILSVKAVADSLGSLEILAALLLAVHPLWPRLSALGSALSIVLFLGTLSFLFTSPGVFFGFSHGLPVLSAQPGQFLVKDVVLIGVAIGTLGESLAARSQRSGRPGVAARPENEPRRSVTGSADARAQ
jgi:uncharacterized membrane protein YkgB